MERIRIVVADDHPFFRDGMRMMLAATPDVELVGEAADGTTAVALAASVQPDVILMDLQMPGLSGVEATRRILRSSPHIGILVLTMYDDDDSVFAAIRAGARGYLLKGTGRQETLDAIRVIAGGAALFSPAVAQRLMVYFGGLKPVQPADIFPELTEREREVLDLIAQGYRNADIVNRLMLSPRTVRNHITNIFSKLQVADRAQAIIRARDAGLGT